MKKITTTLLAVLVAASVFAQAPEKMSYQAVVRDGANALVATQAVGMQISILQGSPTGTAVYVETQTPSTNANGLVSLEIGTGTLVSGDFTTIDWANGTYFIKTETDPTGGTAYTITGTSQLMSVPYALYAKTSGSSTPGPQGPAGNDGTDGAAGATGAQGPAGNDGADGATGATGAQGPAGNDGADGAAGATGAQGPAGNDGADGATGATGAQGVAGNDGADGATGATGAQGVAGNDGADGATGATGAQGPAGNDGADGATGATGAQGPAGNDGADGATGATGAQGPAGNDGADGVGGVTTAGTNVTITGAGTVGSPYVVSASATGTPAEYIYLRPDGVSGGYVTFGTAVEVNGIAYNATTNEFTLKAGKTYMFDGAIYMHTTTSSNTYSYVFYNKTNNASIGSEAYQRTADYSGTIINQPSMAGIVTPATDIQVGIKDIYGGTGGFIASRGFFRVIELK